jgi:hypothetical protein
MSRTTAAQSNGAPDTPRFEVDANFFNPPSLDRHMATILDFDRWKSTVDQEIGNENPLSRTGESALAPQVRTGTGPDAIISQGSPLSRSRQATGATTDKEVLLLDEINEAEDVLFSRIFQFLQIEDANSFSDEDKQTVLEKLDREYIRSIILHEMEHVIQAKAFRQSRTNVGIENQCLEIPEQRSDPPTKGAHTDPLHSDPMMTEKAPATAQSSQSTVRPKRTPAQHLAATGTLSHAMSRLWPTLSAARDT